MYLLEVIKANKDWNFGDRIEADDDRANDLVNAGIAVIVGGGPAMKTKVPKQSARKKGVK